MENETCHIQRPGKFNTDIMEIIDCINDSYLSINDNKVQRQESCTTIKAQHNIISIINSATDIAVFNRHKRLLGITRQPLILGFGVLYGYQTELFAKLNKPCDIYWMKAADYYQLITAKNLWQPISSILAYYMSFMLMESTLFSQYKGLSLCIHLTNEYYRLSETARIWKSLPEYLTNRTLMSRTHIMNILSQLKKTHSLYEMKACL